MNVYQVTFKFEDGQESRTIRAAEGETVLELALDNEIELHHNCGGVCACTTCHVYVLEGMENLPEITEKEEDFIDRAINPRLESRLGCQCEVHGDVTVLIPDQSQYLGH